MEEKKNYDSDFVDETPVDIPIDDRIFKYKPVTAGEENNWLNEVAEIDVKTKKTKTDWAKYNRLKFGRIVEVPYSDAKIKEMTGLDKKFKDLDYEEKWKVFKKLSPVIVNKLTEAMKKIDEPSSEQKKN